MRLENQYRNNYAKTSEMVDFNRTEQLMLAKFEQKVEEELHLSGEVLDLCLQRLKVDVELGRMLRMLVRTRDTAEDLIFQLKRRVATSTEDIQKLTTVLVFYQFMRTNTTQYQVIIREFSKRRLWEVVKELRFRGGDLVGSRILTVVLCIYVKFDDHNKIVEHGPQTIALRRGIEEKYCSGEGEFGIDSDHIRTTCFISLSTYRRPSAAKRTPTTWP